MAVTSYADEVDELFLGTMFEFSLSRLDSRSLALGEEFTDPDGPGVAAGVANET